MSIRETLRDNSLTSSVDRVRKELDRWMDFAVTQGEKAFGALSAGSEHHAPLIDIVELDETIEIRISLPGIDPALVELTLTGNMLTVSAKIDEPDFADGAMVHRRERPRGEYQRSIALPSPVDPDDVVAESRHGVLEVKLAKHERDKKRTIPVKSESAAPA